MELRKNALQLTIGAALVAMIIAMAANWWYSKDRTLVALAKNVYWEALRAKEPELSSRMVAYVTGVRAKANKPYWGGASVYDVVHQHLRGGGYQFDWLRKRPADQEPEASALWELAKLIAHDEIRGTFKPPANLIGADHYLNPKHSGRKNICWFKTSLVLLGKAEPESQHIFYRTPKNAAEKAALPKRANVEECSPPKKPKKKTATSAR